MTRYETVVSVELLPMIRSGDRLPAGFRMVRDLGPLPGRIGEAPSYRSHLVEFEDDDAPAELEGKRVTPTLTLHTDPAGQETVAVTGRAVDPA